MSTTDVRSGALEHRDPLIARAAAVGFELVSRSSDTGQIVWEWRRGEEPRPQFVTERVARHWMFRWLEQFEDAPR